MAGRNYLSHFATFILLFFSSVIAIAGPINTTYQAKIIKPDGYPLEATNVSFVFTIYSPIGNCPLYSESYSSVNMASTGGLISFTLGSGIKSFPASSTTFAQVFSNITPNMACDTGGGPPAVYTPLANDTRRVVMQFNDGAGWQTLPPMNINAVPYAMYANDAQKFNGLEVSEFVRLSILPTCGVSDALTYNGAAFSCVAAGGGGSVTSGSVITALGYTPVAPASLTAVSSDVSSVSGAVATVSTYASSVSATVSSFQSTVAASFAAITSSQWVTSGASLLYNSGNVGIGTTSASALLDIGDYGTPVFKPTVLISNDVSGISGVEMKNKSLATNAEFRFAVFDTTYNYLAFTQPSVSNTGTIFGLPRSQTSMIITNSNSSPTARDLAIGTYKANHVVFGTNSYERVRITASGSVGVGTSAPVTALDVAGGVRVSFESATCAVSYAGTIRYNGGAIEYCNGSAWTALGVSGAGLTLLNGSASNTQTFQFGSTGTAPVINTAAGVHTFNIPLASVGAVTAGLLSNADYVAFNNKASSVSVTNISNSLTTVSNSVTTLANTTATSFANLTTTVSAIVSSQWATVASGIHYSSGNVGIGTSAPTAKLDVDTLLYNQGQYGIESNIDQYISSSGGYSVVGIHNWLRPMVSGGATNGSTIYGNAHRVVRNTKSVDDNGTAATVFGAHYSVGHSNMASSTPITNYLAGIQIEPAFGAGTIGTYYGLRLTTSPISGASVTARYGFGQDDTLAKNYFLGNVAIGATSATARLFVGANTVSEPAVKLAASTLIATPQAGAIEYDGSSYYLTDGGGARRAIATVSGAGNFSGVSQISSTGNITLSPSGSVIVSSTTASTNSSTGALVVAGGLGVAGNINASGAITTSDNIQGASITATNGMITPIIYGSTNISGVLRLESTTNATKGYVLIAQQGGTVGIGTNTPLAKLSVDGDGMSPNSIIPGTVATFDHESADVAVQLFTGSTRKANIFYGVTGAASRGALSYQFNPTPINDQLQFNVNTQTRMVITGSGTVGIGTTTPTANLDVRASVFGGGIDLHATDGVADDDFGISWKINSTEHELARIYAQYPTSAGGGDGALKFKTRLGGTLSDRMTILANGNVGVGLTAPQAKLSVSGQIVAAVGNGGTGGYSFIGDAGYDSGLFQQIAGTVELQTQGTPRLYITTAGSVGIGTTSPTAKLDVAANAGVASETTTYATMVIKDNEAQLDIITPSGGQWGSGINLVETSSTTKLIENSWSIYRGSSELSDSTLHFKYGTDKTVGNNATLFSMTTEGRMGLGTATPGARLHVRTPTSGTVNNRITSGNSNNDLINVTGLTTSEIHLDHLVGAKFYANTPTAVSRVVTLKIDNAPTVSGTNLTVDNLLALHVESGNSAFGGNLGVGTLSPAQRLHVLSTGGGGMVVEDTTSPFINLRRNATNEWFMTAASATNTFELRAGNINNTPAMAINASTGYMGLGTSAPAAKLNIGGLGATHATALRIDSQDTYYRDILMSEFNSTAYGGIIRYHSGADLLQLITLENSVEKYGVAVARATGFVGIGMNSAASYPLDVNGDIRITGTPYRNGGDSAWIVPSDARLKDVTGKYQRGLREIANIDTIYFNYKKDNAKAIDSTVSYTGVIAQQVQTQIPEAVKEDKDGFLSLNTTPIFWAMVNAIKEVYQQVVEVMKNDQAQDRMIASVKAENEAIKAENSKIKQENATIKAYLCEKDPQASICK